MFTNSHGVIYVAVLENKHNSLKILSDSVADAKNVNIHLNCSP